MARIKTFVYTVVFFGVIGFGAWYYVGHREQVNGWVQKAGEKVGVLQSKIDGGLDSAKQKGMGESGEDAQ